MKFTFACKCHVLADFQKKCQFLEKTQICQKFPTGFGRVFSVSKVFGRFHMFPAQSLSVSGSFCVICIEKMLHSL